MVCMISGLAQPSIRCWYRGKVDPWSSNLSIRVITELSWFHPPGKRIHEHCVGHIFSSFPVCSIILNHYCGGLAARVCIRNWSFKIHHMKRTGMWQSGICRRISGTDQPVIVVVCSQTFRQKRFELLMVCDAAQRISKKKKITIPNWSTGWQHICNAARETCI